MLEKSTNFQIFNNKKNVENLVLAINKLSSELKQVTIMEVCGTHTNSIAKYGIKNLLSKNIKLVSGPGCPVCVTPNNQIDQMIYLAKQKNIIIASFGDMIRVPGSKESLSKVMAEGANIKVIYSPLDAIELAKKNPTKEIVFLGIGFETTCPATAATILEAHELKLKNFSVYCAHKNMPNALNFLANDKQVKIDGLLLPGHVSTIIGIKPYQFLAKSYKLPGVISGFEAVDILHAILMLLENIQATQNNGLAKIQNAYTRGVKLEGNTNAKKLIEKVFDVNNSTWRGLGNIKNSGYIIKKMYAKLDACKKFKIKNFPEKENNNCKCGDVLRGIITPQKCSLYGKKCSPQNPIGPCMVSSEGSCAAAFKWS